MSEVDIVTRLAALEKTMRLNGRYEIADDMQDALLTIERLRKQESEAIADRMVVNDGGPAFPHGPLGASFTGPDGYTTHQGYPSAGMSLRAYFAGQALSAMIIADPRIGYGLAAEHAVGHADALIAELQK